MAMRELITGGAACAVPGSGQSSSNPLGALANALTGSSSKTQERLNEIPTSATTGPGGSFYQDYLADPYKALPGNELDHSLHPPHAEGLEFLQGFRSSSTNEFADAWNEARRSTLPFTVADAPLGHTHSTDSSPQIADGPPQRVLSNFLHQFVGSSHGGVPFVPTPLPQLGLSVGDKKCIRDRSTIMARHMCADMGEDFINGQVNALLTSLDIDHENLTKDSFPGRFRELEGYWNESQGALRGYHHSSEGWIEEFNRQRANFSNSDSWARSFEQQHGANGWVSEFDQEQRLSSVHNANSAAFSNATSMEQTRMLAQTLAQNNDPKFQNSKFLQFVSKMSRGELIIDDNQVKEAPFSAPGHWGTEFEEKYVGESSWADEYSKKLSRGPSQWADEFASVTGLNEIGDQLVDDFSKLHMNDWAEEFRQQVDDDNSDWANAYDDYLNEQMAVKQKSSASKGIYVFSDLNPYVGHPNPMREGQELFRKGLLSEAVLALEAEVLKNPANAEGWRLLGITHAENDDDVQAISAMMSAHEADPTNLEVLLALGVSHTNELEQAAALKYLYGWLQNHPKYGGLARPEMPNSLYYGDVVRSFNEAEQMSPEDADVHIVLGVLYNLSREYDKAIASFQTALKLKPNDYSLWNKLGATQANSVQSAGAILAYQKALDLKPNYVRAWANMGISYANQGRGEDSIRYYVRALTMNPKADNTWHYLRISLSYASRNDLLDACDSRNLDLLQKEFPL